MPAKGDLQKVVEGLEAELEQECFQRFREALLSQSAKDALYEAHMRYQIEQRPSEDHWLTTLLEAVADAIGPEKGS